MKNTFAAIFIVFGLVLVGAACEKADDQNNANTNQTTNRTNSSNVNRSDDGRTDDEESNRNASSNANGNVNRSANVNSNSNASDDDDDENAGTLRITGPEKNKQVESPLTVEGKAPNGPVFVRVKTASGKVLFTVPGTARNGEFSVKITFEFTNTTSGSIEVYTKDADGNEDVVAAVPVSFKVESDDDDDDSNTNSNSNSNSNTNSADDDAADDTDDDNPTY
ncbi:MAG: hypothetical protein HY976_02130 [Candidatus Kerfeldbacteria bacterium]|nr:hypothetical protein [Candidatus Kerfeldbacteria bacterium]